MIRQILGEVSVPVANTEVQQVIENPHCKDVSGEIYAIAYQLSRAACCCDCDTAYWY